MSDEQQNGTSTPETPEEAKRRRDRDRKREQRKREREIKTKAAAELAVKLASEQARVDAEYEAKCRLQFLRNELSGYQNGHFTPPPENHEEFRADVEYEIAIYLTSLGFQNDFERLFRVLSVLLPDLLRYRGIEPLTRDELMELEWADKGFNGPQPSKHEPPPTFGAFIGSSPSSERFDRELLEHITFKATLLIQRQKGEQEEITKVLRQRVSNAGKIWKANRKTGSGARTPALKETGSAPL